jgi:hypothetical protein
MWGQFWPIASKNGKHIFGRSHFKFENHIDSFRITSSGPIIFIFRADHITL